jgi:hypothetical protein
MIPLPHFVLAATLLQSSTALDTSRVQGPVRTPAFAAPVTASPLSEPLGQQEQQLVEYSDGYALRATIHKASSYAMLPVFALQYYSGTLLVRERNGWSYAPEWAHRLHGPLAYGMAGLFTVNTVTGVWNLWEARNDPEDRKRRTWHAMLMLAADAGFVTTAFLIPKDGPPPPVPIDPPRPHRTVAIVSMGAAALSYTIMLPFFRKD